MKGKNFTVSITGDIDTFVNEDKLCLQEYFDVLDRYGIKCTIPVTAEAVQKFPDRANYIIERGHEIAGHGDTHTSFTGDLNTQVARLNRMIEMIYKYTGYRVQGFRSPYIKADRNLYPALKKVGLKYDSTQKIFGYICKYIPYYRKYYLDGVGYKYFRYFFRLAGKLYNSLNGSVRSPYSLSGITEIPVIGDSDYTLIHGSKGPNYKKKDAIKISDIWLEHINVLKKTTSAVAIQIHPGRVSYEYLESLNCLCKACRENGVEFSTLINIHNKFVESKLKL